MRKAKIEAIRKITLNEMIDLNIEEDIIILPPANATEAVSDEDSGDEDFVCVENLPHSVLNSVCEIEGNNFEENSDDDDKTSDPKKRRFDRKWVKKDLEFSPTNEFREELNDCRKVLFDNKTPTDTLERFFNHQIIELIVKYSNLYALQQNDILDVSESEIKVFLAILMVSGYVKMPNYKMYWEKSVDIPEIIPCSMRRDRFIKIKKYLHFCDNLNLDKNDTFTKLRPLISMLNDLFLKFAPFEESHSIDESMVPYFGHHSAKQSMRNKPVRFGFKVWGGATSSGYLVWFDPYGGRNANYDKLLGLGGSVVKTYAQRLLLKSNMKYHLVFDNFFTSLKTFDLLKELGLHGTGTVRSNRLENCPLKDITLKNSERGAYEFAYEENSKAIVCIWKDNSIVSVVSNYCPVEPVGVAKRWCGKSKKKIDIKQPNIVANYNQFMGGLDRFDQNIAHLRPQIRGKKWWWSLAMYCLLSASNNAWQLYRKHTENIDFSSFVRICAITWLKTHGVPPARGHRLQGRASALSTISRFDGSNHFVCEQNKQTRCGHCHKKTTTRCVKCDVGVHVRCFIDYHSQ